MTDENSYTFRSNFPTSEARQRHAAFLLGELEKAVSETDPRRADTSAKGKDYAAFSALLKAGDLVRVVAGWALDHVYGVSLVEQKMLPIPMRRAREEDEYVRYRALVDRHEHERVGGPLYDLGEDADGKSLSPTQKRMLLRNLLFVNSAGLPDWLRREAIEAIDGLAFGHEAEILRTNARRARLVTLKTLRARLQLVAIVRFQSAVGGSVERARKFVAERACVGEETLKGWERDLKEPDSLGSVEFRSAIERATNAASFVKRALEKEAEGCPVSEDEAEMKKHYLRQYDAEAVALAKAQLNG